MSWRKFVLIIAALVGAVTFVPTVASARGGFRGGGFARGGFRGGGFRGRGFGWGAPAVGLGIGLGLAGAGYSGGYYGGYPYGCWRRTVVYTPYGPRSRRIWVCD
jgi:hypothetical protein